MRDADATRKRLIDAARAEFAAYGISGARVDRIAEQAAANKAQIYHYFGSKDALFDAVFDEIIEQVVTEIPLDTDDLAGYARRLAADYATHPDILRLATWQRLERGASDLHRAAVDSNRAKIAEIARAQSDGRLPDRYPADVLLALILHLAAFWASIPAEVAAAGKLPKPHTQLDLVTDVTTRLLEQ